MERMGLTRKSSDMTSKKQQYHMQPDKIFLVTSELNALLKETKGGEGSVSGWLLAPSLRTLPC